MVRKAEFLLVCCVSVAVLSLCFLSATTVPHRYTRINEPYQLPECMTSGGDQRDCFNSHDRISAVHFKLLADHYIGNYSVPATYADQLRRIRMSEPSQLDNQITKDGAVIFVEPLKLKEFVSVASRIRTRFILITGDGDECLPDCVLSQDETLSLTENPKLIKWYVTNCVGTEVSDKLECIPIGLNQHKTSLVDMQKMYESGVGLVNGLEPKNWDWETRRPRYILSSYSLWTNRTARRPAYNYFCGWNWENDPNKKYIQSATNCIFKSGVSGLSFAKHVLAPSMFVVAPHGRGLDCYRTWETLLLGGYPIVTSSSIDALYDNLPVLIVKRWDDVTEELLERTVADFRVRKFDYSKLYMDYWAKHILSSLE